MDDSATSYVDLQRSLRAAAAWVRKHKSPTDQVALFSIGSGVRVWQPFTADRSLLLRRLRAMTRERPADSEGDRIRDLVRQLSDCRGFTHPHGGNGLQCATDAVREFKEEETDQLPDRIASLRALVEMLGLFPGHKTVLYLGDGFLMNPGQFAAYAIAAYFGGAPDLAMSTYPYTLRPVTDAALRANVTFYTIDAHGLRVDSIMGDASQEHPPNMTGPAAVDFAVERQHAPEDSLNDLAWDTGGLALTNTNDLARSIHVAVGGIAGTYYASYQPTEIRLDGRYRKITIRSLRPRVRVRTRAGYYALPVREFPVRAKVLPFRRNGSRFLVPVRFSLNPSVLRWRGFGSRRHDLLVVAHTLMDSHQRLVTQRVQELDAAYPGSKPVKFEIGWNLLPGAYRGVVEITEARTSDFGDLTFRMRVP